MQKMQLIQPEIKKLQAKYKNDRQKLNEEIMKFYKENKINPMAGCLPLVFQMPIFFALFRVLQRAAQARADGFEALSRPSVATWPPRPAARTRTSRRACVPRDGPLARRPSDATGGFTDALPYFLLIALVVVTGYLQFKQTQSRQTSQANPQMAMMGKIFPVDVRLHLATSCRAASSCTSSSATPGRSASRPSSSGRCPARWCPAARRGAGAGSAPRPTGKPGGAKPKPSRRAELPSRRRKGGSSGRWARPGRPAKPVASRAATVTARPSRARSRPPAAGRAAAKSHWAGPNPPAPNPGPRSAGGSRQRQHAHGMDRHTGKTVAEAVEAALDELGVDEADIEYEVARGVQARVPEPPRRRISGPDQGPGQAAVPGEAGPAPPERRRPGPGPQGRRRWRRTGPGRGPTARRERSGGGRSGAQIGRRRPGRPVGSGRPVRPPAAGRRPDRRGRRRGRPTSATTRPAAGASRRRRRRRPENASSGSASRNRRRRRKPSGASGAARATTVGDQLERR